MSDLTLTCPPPFLPQSRFPPTGGYIEGRFCGPFTESLYCCLPCPLQQWVYSDSFQRNADIAYWFNVPAFIAQVFLLASFAFLKDEDSRGHYMSVGLIVGLMILELSFIIPLGTKPDKCFNEITPNDMHSSQNCAWTGAMLEAGSMATVVWILLRSLWTHMRVCWDIKHTPTYMYIAHVLGWGLPLLFLTISLAVTGVSYRMGGTCIANPENAFATWFGWLIAFGCLAAVIQFITTGFCIIVYLRDLTQGDNNPTSTTTSTTGSKGISAPSSQFGGKRFAWRRVHKVLLMQWRSIVLSILVIVECLYFGTVYVAQTKAAEAAAEPAKVAQVQAWTLCLISSGGDREECLELAEPLQIGQGTVVGSLFVASLIGLFTFCLMFRFSMLTGWYKLLRDPRRMRESVGSVGDFVLINPRKVKRPSAGNGQVAERGEVEKLTGVLPSPVDDRRMSVPEPGDVSTRHDTVVPFGDDEHETMKEKRRARGGEDDVV